VQGTDIDAPISGGIEEAVKAAQGADAVVLMLGISESEEGESHDRTDIDLPQPQHDLAAAVLKSLGSEVRSLALCLHQLGSCVTMQCGPCC